MHIPASVQCHLINIIVFLSPGLHTSRLYIKDWSILGKREAPQLCYKTMRITGQQHCTVQNTFWRMVSSWMLRRVTLLRTNVSEELSASIIRVTSIGELGTTLAVTSNRLPDTGIALFLYMQMMFVPHRKHVYGLPLSVTGMAWEKLDGLV
jgi:hypothetical protein